MRHATCQTIPPRPAAPRTGAKRPAARPGLATKARLTSLPCPPGAERHVDFVAYAAVRLRATTAEVAAAREAGRAMRAKLDRLAARPTATPTAATPAVVRPAAPIHRPGFLPFPPDELTPARPADAAPRGRYTRVAAA